MQIYNSTRLNFILNTEKSQRIALKVQKLILFRNVKYI